MRQRPEATPQHVVMHLRDGSEAVVAVRPHGHVRGTVFVIPGWKGTDLGLARICSSLASRGYRVVCINLPGMGLTRSDQGCCSGLEKLAGFVESVMRDSALSGPRLLIGHSFGATIASAIASRRAVGVGLQGLLLVSPVVSPPIARRGLAGVAARSGVKLSNALFGSAPRLFADAMIRSQALANITNASLTTDGWSGYRHIRLGSRLERGFAADPRLAATYYRLAAEHGCLQFAAGVRVGTEIVAGDRDQLASPLELERLRTCIPHAHLTLLEGAGHLAHHEAPDKLAGLVADATVRLEINCARDHH